MEYFVTDKKLPSTGTASSSGFVTGTRSITNANYITTYGATYATCSSYRQTNPTYSYLLIGTYATTKFPEIPANAKVLNIYSYWDIKVNATNSTNYAMIYNAKFTIGGNDYVVDYKDSGHFTTSLLTYVVSRNFSSEESDIIDIASHPEIKSSVQYILRDPTLTPYTVSTECLYTEIEYSVETVSGTNFFSILI